MATKKEKWQEIANRGLQDKFDPNTRAKFDEAVKRGLITLPDTQLQSAGRTQSSGGFGKAFDIAARIGSFAGKNPELTQTVAEGVGNVEQGLNTAKKEIGEGLEFAGNVGKEFIAQDPRFKAAKKLQEVGSEFAQENIPLETRQNISRFGRPLLQTGGAATGILVAAPIAGAELAAPITALTPLPAATVALGEGLGLTAGDKSADVLDNFLGLKEIPETTISSQADIVKESAENTALVIAASAVIPAVIAPFKFVKNQAKKGIEFTLNKTKESMATTGSKVLEVGDRLNIDTLPSEILKSKPLLRLESVLARVPLAAGIMERFKLMRIRRLLEIRDDLVERQGGSKDIEETGKEILRLVDEAVNAEGKLVGAELKAARESVLVEIGSTQTGRSLGGTIQDSIIESKRVFRNEKQARYEEWSTLVKNTLTPETDKVVLNETRKVAQKELSELLKAQQGGVDVDATLIKRLNRFLSQTNPGGARINTAEQTAAARKGINGWIEKEVKSLENVTGRVDSQFTNEGRIYAKLKKAMDKDLNDFADGVGGDIKKSLDNANLFFKEGSERLNNKAIKKVLKSDPERVVESMKTTSDILALKKALAPAEFNTFKQAHTNKLLKVDTEGFTSAGLRRELDKIRKSTLAEIYTEAEIKQLQELATRGITLEAKLVPNKFLKSIINSEFAEETIVNKIVRDNNVGTVRAVTKILKNAGRSDLLDNVRVNILENRILKKSGGVFDPRHAADEVDKMGKTFDELFTDSSIKKDILDLAFLARQIPEIASPQAKSAVIGDSFGNIATGGAVGSFILGGVPGVALFILTSREVAVMYTSKRGRDLLKLSMTMKNGDPRSNKVISDIMLLLGNTIAVSGKQVKDQSENKRDRKVFLRSKGQ